MPTLAKAQLTEAESPWLEIWDEMYRYLCRNRGPILTILGFYAEHDFRAPEDGSVDSPTQEEDAELQRIATALTQRRGSLRGHDKQSSRCHTKEGFEKSVFVFLRPTPWSGRLDNRS